MSERRALRTVERRHLMAVGCLLVSALLAACHRDQPIRIGFVAGLSGRVSDLGGPARNGAMLAIEEANAAGGIKGRQIELLVRDDQQDISTARKAVSEMLDRGVVAIVGPTTSSIAVGVIDLADDAQVLMVGTSVTTNELADRDDYFIRVLSPTREHVAGVADFFSAMGITSYSALYDVTNQSYTESWLHDFSARFAANGGHQVAALPFASGDPQQLIDISTQAVMGSPDMVILIANAVDAALLAKQIRGADDSVQIATSEWAGTERLIELGGRWVEGAFVPQYFDRESREQGFQAFRQRFVARFGHEPGFPGVSGYNAATTILEALRHAQPDETLREYILGRSVFDGVQGPIRYNPYGDADTPTFVTQIVDGVFQVASSH